MNALIGLAGVYGWILFTALTCYALGLRAERNRHHDRIELLRREALAARGLDPVTGRATVASKTAARAAWFARTA